MINKELNNLKSPGKSHGALTTKIARKIALDWEERGYKVLYDHDPSNENVGKIVSWFGEQYGRGTQLSHIDIAIVEKSSNKVFALIEIEDTADRPKTFIGDVFSILMGEHIGFSGKYQLSVNEDTTLIVLGKSKVSHEKRNRYLREKVMESKAGLSTGNSVIGNVVIETFADENELFVLMPYLLERVFRGGV